MIHEVECARFRLRAQSHVFHFKNFYRLLWHWILEEEYVSADDGSDKPEILYYERRTQTRGKEYYIWWRMKKDIEKNQYYRRILNIDIKALNVKDMEIMQQGVKFKTQKGEIDMWITAKLELDYNKTWRENWFLKGIEEFYWKKLMWKDFERQRIRTYREAYRLHQKIRGHFEFKRFTPEVRPWRPPRGAEDEELASV